MSLLIFNESEYGHLHIRLQTNCNIPFGVSGTLLIGWHVVPTTEAHPQTTSVFSYRGYYCGDGCWL